MLDLGLELHHDEQQTVLVQDEPALEIALPQVFTQPELTTLQRGKLPQVERLALSIVARQQEQPGTALGPEYQELVSEFQPLFAWAIACWDYLLSTEGCRFLPRASKQKFGVRGDYRAVTDADYSRLVHGVFRDCILAFAQHHATGSPTTNGHAHSNPSLSPWLRERFWPLVLSGYRRLENPPDPRQRILTPYSYLRCVPYEFLNEYHQDLVYGTVRRLPEMEWKAVDTYFLHFYTEPSTADALSCTLEDGAGLLRQALLKLLLNDRLVYCLLRQIERY